MRPIILWILWGAILVGFIAIYATLGHVMSLHPAPGVDPRVAWIALAPLTASAALRWLVLPHAPSPQAALAMWILGLALAEAGGIIGLVLGGPVYRDPLAVLALLGIAQFIPLPGRAQ